MLHAPKKGSLEDQWFDVLDGMLYATAALTLAWLGSARALGPVLVRGRIPLAF